MRLLNFYCFVFLIQVISGQVTEETPNTATNLEPGLSLEAFSYPLFLGGEEHGTFTLGYTFATPFKIELNGFYDTYRETNRFRSNLRIKSYLTDNWYLFSGGELEMDTNKYGLKENLIPRIGFISGVGYDVNNNFLFEAGSNLQINNSYMGAFGEHRVLTPQVYSFSGKFKF